MASGNRQSTVVAKLLPRVRGIRGIPGMPSRIPGTTSAYAENTGTRSRGRWLPRNYLRVRGEYIIIFTSAPAPRELPPRARRIPNQRFGHGHRGWNYLRVRGEYGVPGHMMDMDEELPPRARRIQVSQINAKAMIGTTSACAENTLHSSGKWVKAGNYLRVRGEYPLLDYLVELGFWNYLRVRGEYIGAVLPGV